MPLDVVRTLADLVAIPSVNPMGHPCEGDQYYEHRMTDYLEERFERMGLAWQRQSIAPKRDNIIARLDGRVPPAEGGAVLLFEVHQDTVPVDGMTIEPWNPEIRAGRLYGRGSCDVKGGMAAMLSAVSRLAEERPADMPTIVLACTVNEEHGFTGATALAQMWAPGAAASIVPRRPDAAVIAEPTRLQVVIAHKGTVRWRCHVHGRAAHSSQPHMGDNAIYKMSRVLAALESYAREVSPKFPKHPLCGPSTLSVGTIHGGISVNTVPALCTIEIDRRIVPGENGDEAHRQVVDYVSRYPGVDFPVDHEKPFLLSTTLPDTHNGPLAERLSAAVRQSLGSCEKIGVPFGTDASVIAAAGVPAVVFGPGSIDQAHTADEWISIDQLRQSADVLYEFARQGL
jgi:acetylornithine deacetylase/succinyl-diaminopimelate desuccinylase family protein